MRFSTVDQRGQGGGFGSLGTSCNPGAWWLADCDFDSNLNGIFTTENNDVENIFWRSINEKIIRTEMKIQPCADKGECLVHLLHCWQVVSLLLVLVVNTF